MLNLDKNKLRDLPGWERNAPVPICMGGDYRALTFCCKPGYSLTFGFKCRRDEVLAELGISKEEFIKYGIRQPRVLKILLKLGKDTLFPIMLKE